MMTEGNVLDHPVEKQREYAASFGLSLDEWRVKMIESNKSTDAFVAKLNANPVRLEDLPPNEREAFERFQARVDDEELTNSVLRRRAEAESGKT